MIYLYALTDERPQGFCHLGLDDEPVHSMTCSGLHLVHSQHPDNFEAIVTPTALWTHESVVDELLETGAVVPFRFGTTVPDRVWAASS